MSALIARRYSHFFVGNIDVCQVDDPIVTSTRINPNHTTVLSGIHLIKSASSIGSVIKYHDHLPAVYRQSWSENAIVV
jgi:hypothetical protein